MASASAAIGTSRSPGTHSSPLTGRPCLSPRVPKPSCSNETPTNNRTPTRPVEWPHRHSCSSTARKLRSRWTPMGTGCPAMKNARMPYPLWMRCDRPNNPAPPPQETGPSCLMKCRVKWRPAWRGMRALVIIVHPISCTRSLRPRLLRTEMRKHMGTTRMRQRCDGWL